MIMNEWCQRPLSRVTGEGVFIRVQGFEPVIPIICYNSYQ